MLLNTTNKQAKMHAVVVALLVLLYRTSDALDIQTETVHLYPTFTAGIPQFGSSVAMSADGSRVIVGAKADDVVATAAGAAYVFDRSATDGSAPIDILYPANAVANAGFGTSVALSPSGGYALVGTPLDDTMGVGVGAAYLFVFSDASSNYTLTQTLFPTNPSGEFGTSVAVGEEYAWVGAPRDDTAGVDAGAVYVFWNPDNTSFAAFQTLFPDVVVGSPKFGQSLAVGSFRMIVGAHDDDTAGANAGAAYVFEQSQGGNYTQISKVYPANPVSGPRFGYSVALSLDGTRLLVGAYEDDTLGTLAGSAHVFVEVAGNFTVIDVLYPSSGAGSPRFGTAVALSADGTRAVVGAPSDDIAYPGAGAAYMFDQESSNASQGMILMQRLEPLASDTPVFGQSVAVSPDGSWILVGAVLDDLAGADSGAADWIYVTTVIDTPIVISAEDPLIIAGNLNVAPNNTITIVLSDTGNPAIIVSGCASFGGTLVLNVTDPTVGDTTVVVATYNELCANYTPFTQLETAVECGEAAVEETDYGGTSFSVLVDIEETDDCDNSGADSGAFSVAAIVGAAVGAVAVVAFVCCVLATSCIICMFFAVTPVVGGNPYVCAAGSRTDTPVYSACGKGPQAKHQRGGHCAI